MEMRFVNCLKYIVKINGNTFFASPHSCAGRASGHLGLCLHKHSLRVMCEYAILFHGHLKELV